MRARIAGSVALLVVACTPSPVPVVASAPVPTIAPPREGPVEAPPKLRLPADVHPTGETVWMTIDPTRTHFSGSVDVRVAIDRARRVFWLHGRGLTVSRATVTPEGGPTVSAVWQEHDGKGTSSLTVASALPPGPASIHIEYEAAFAKKQEGLFTLTAGEVPYAFTQFENIAARQAFPCFDEPGFKIPWDVTLTVPKDDAAIANTSEVAREPDEKDASLVRIHFARTKPLPSYLVAFAVGPLDVVKGPDVPASTVRPNPVPLRGVATRGRGVEMAYAVAHAGEILTMLESYFGIAYPYDKVDILAIPDMGGAMENAAALTFNDGLLLFDPKIAPSSQVREYAQVMTHELAHQWVGDLVTAAWWDDIWLNEAFATFMEARADVWDPTTGAKTALLTGVHDAMGSDSLTSARSIRQPIESVDDIANAFDNITYQKGGGVLAMFERWVGPETFRRGLTEYLREHQFGTATAEDFLAAESRVAGKDVATPFKTFLEQPGVPFVQATVLCDGVPRVHFSQSRFLPAFSTGSRSATWQIPLCARVGHGARTSEACLLLTATEGDVVVASGCPDWVLPNADAAGYFRFGLAPHDLTALLSLGVSRLSADERAALGDSLQASLDQGATSLADALRAAASLAGDAHADVARRPMDLVSLARKRLSRDPLRPRVEAYARDLFRAAYRRLGWQPTEGETREVADLRVRVVAFMVTTARDPQARAEAARRARAYLGAKSDAQVHPDAVAGDLVPVALRVLGEGADVALWEELHDRLVKSEDAELRATLVDALSVAERPELAARARGLILDKTLRATEALTPLVKQLDDVETQDAAWGWMKEHWDEIVTTTPSDTQSSIVSMPSVFCDDAHRAEVAAFLSPRIATIDGGPRELAKTLESIQLCAARRAGDEASARTFFAKKAR